jgi:hypothetical protein
MSHRRSGSLAGALALLVALLLVPAAGATPATVRIVGDAVGIEPTAVDTTPDPVGPGACPGDSAAGAIDKAVNGNWDRLAFTQRILGETHDYSANDFWNYWINDTSSQEGICEHIVVPGDRILMFVQRNDDSFNPTVFPLTLSDVPASVVAGKPFTVTVRELRYDGVSTTTPTPIAGATVAGGGSSAQTDAAGKATLTLTPAGQVSLRATRPGDVISEAAVVMVTGVSGGGPGGTPPPPPSASSGLQAPGATIRGIAEGQRFARGKGPRELKVKAYAGAGLLIVKLRLTRDDRGKCSTFSGKSERFRHVKCGAQNGFWFGVGNRAETSYLLPSRLPRGRYVLDVNTIDKAYHRDDTRRRGGNRIVFHVG